MLPYGLPWGHHVYFICIPSNVVGWVLYHCFNKMVLLATFLWELESLKVRNYVTLKVLLLFIVCKIIIIIIIIIIITIIIIIIIFFIETRFHNTIGKIINYRWLGLQVGSGCKEYRKVDSTARWRKILTSSSISLQCSEVIGEHSQEHYLDPRRLS